MRSGNFGLFGDLKETLKPAWVFQVRFVHSIPNIIHSRVAVESFPASFAPKSFCGDGFLPLLDTPRTELWPLPPRPVRTVNLIYPEFPKFPGDGEVSCRKRLGGLLR
jgi:hypothetical protein